MDQEQEHPKDINSWDANMEGTSWHVVKSEKAIYVYANRQIISYKWFSGGYVPKFEEEWQNEFANSSSRTFIKLSLE